jgi:hypothetical protein
MTTQLDFQLHPLNLVRRRHRGVPCCLSSTIPRINLSPPPLRTTATALASTEAARPPARPLSRLRPAASHVAEYSLYATLFPQ